MFEYMHFKLMFYGKFNLGVSTFWVQITQKFPLKLSQDLGNLRWQPSKKQEEITWCRCIARWSVTQYMEIVGRKKQRSGISNEKCVHESMDVLTVDLCDVRPSHYWRWTVRGPWTVHRSFQTCYMCRAAGVKVDRVNRHCGDVPLARHVLSAARCCSERDESKQLAPSTTSVSQPHPLGSRPTTSTAGTSLDASWGTHWQRVRTTGWRDWRPTKE